MRIKLPSLSRLLNFYINRDNADIALAQYDDKYIRENGIEYIAIIRTNNPILKYKLEFGVSDDNITIQKWNTKAKANILTIPSNLPVHTEAIPFKAQTKFIKSKIKRVGKIAFIEHLKDEKFEQRSISNENSHLGGTLGGTFHLSKFSGTYGITNWHVLYKSRAEYGDDFTFDLNLPIYYPRLQNYDSKTEKKHAEMGKTIWASDKNLDACIFKITKENHRKVIQKSVQHITSIIPPKFNLIVSFSGLSTRYKCGEVRSDNTTVKVDSNKGIYRNQIQLKRISQKGDSGSILFHGKHAVGLLFSSSKEGKNQFSYANRLDKIFDNPRIVTLDILNNNRVNTLHKLILKPDRYV